ncbi:SGNH/GDSL hydrolase family protein [Vibrio alginolyticus]|uniref:SGNH/GDSL hydrolase family protein n=1 Tax=Vibrio alginolyticus TaxID=663 RepID=UPI001558D569|nr:SGNH/GDSL hydrolase family protein [Vibrio alginolyticus]
MTNSNNFFLMMEELRQYIDWLNQILIGGEQDTVTVGGVIKPSISKDIADKWSAIQAMVQGRQAYETKASLPAVPPENVALAEVWRDATPENNGLYGWTGTEWEKSPFDSIARLVSMEAEISAIIESMRQQGISGLMNHFPNGKLEPLADGTHLSDGVTIHNKQPQDEFSLIPDSSANTVLAPMGLTWAYRMKKSGAAATNRHFVHDVPSEASGRYILASFLCFSDDISGDGINPWRGASFYVGKNGNLGDGSNGVTEKTSGVENLGNGVYLKWFRFRAFNFGSEESLQIYIGDTSLGSATNDAWLCGLNYAISDNPISYEATSWNAFVSLGVYSRIESNESKIREIESGKADIEIPGISIFTNAVTNRVATKYVLPSKHNKPSNDYELSTRLVEFPYDETAHRVFGEPNAMVVSSIDDGTYSPTTCYKVYPDDLAKLGITPSDINPPLVDLRAAVRLDNEGTDNDAVQIFFALQYSLSETLTETYNPLGNNVLFVDGRGTAQSSYLGGGDSFWTHLTSGKTVDGVYRVHGHSGVKVPATYNGLPFRGIKIIALGKKPSNYIPGTRRYLTTFGLAVTKSNPEGLSLTQPYWNLPEDSFGYVSYQDLDRINIDMASKVSGEVVPVWVNAVRGRYGVGALEREEWGGADTLLSYEPHTDILQTTGERNVIKGVSSKKSAYRPLIAHRVDLEYLAKIGIEPDDKSPPIISMRAAWTKSLITQHDQSRLQIFFILRYGGNDSHNYNPSTDVLFNTGSATASWIGHGDELWNHQAKRIENEHEIIYVHNGIPVPATYNGQPLTAIIINGLGYPQQDGNGDIIAQSEWQLGMHKFAVVPGQVVQPDLLYLNAPDDSPKVFGIEKQQLSEDLANALVWKEDGGESGRRHILTIKNSDKITILGDSYSASHYTQKDKAYISRLSELVDWRFENFARSGDDYAEINERIVNGTCEYHPSISFKDYGSTYALLISFTNDTYYRSANTAYFRDNIRRLTESVKSCGAEPIISTEFVSGAWHEIATVGAVAREDGHRFIDIASPARTFDATRYNQYWGGGHPAVRTNGLFVDPLLPHIESLPRPKQSIKLFRKRPTWTGNDASLLYDSIEQRVHRWKEISVGHHALVENLAPYYDRMEDIKNEQGGYRYQNVTSEYLKLQNREVVDMGSHMLAEIIVPTTASNLAMGQLFISDAQARVYVRNALANVDWNAYLKRKAYVVDDGVTANAGDTYTLGFGGPVVTVVGMATDVDGKRLLITSSYKDGGSSAGGTLERNSGTGPVSITYHSTMYGFEPEYYADLNKPRGQWVELENVDGMVALKDKTVIRQAMNYDKLVFMIVNPLGIQLNDISFEWYGEEGKDAGIKSMLMPNNGQAQVLPVTTVDDLTGWTVIGALLPADPHDGVLPKGTTKMVTVSDGNRLRQSFSNALAGRYSTTADVVVWARRYPEHFIPSSNQAAAYLEYESDAPITSDTCDYRTLEIKMHNSDNDSQSYKTSRLVGLHWSEHRFRIDMPADGLSLEQINLEVYSPDGELEVALVEVYV